MPRGDNQPGEAKISPKSTPTPATERAPSTGEVRSMFDAIAPRYDLLNHLMSAGWDIAWRRRTVDRLPRNSRLILDIAIGSGDLAITSLRRSKTTVVGLDLSASMLERANTKIRRLGLAGKLPVVQGDALALPFPDGTFDAVTIAFGLRNIPDRPAALAEMARVVRISGKVLVLEMTLPRTRMARGFFRLYLQYVIPALGRLFSTSPHAYRYLPASIRAFPSPDELTAVMEAAGLDAVQSRSMSLGITHLHEGTVA